MILMEYHLICIDVCQIHFVTYFNLIWRANNSDAEDAHVKRKAEPVRYLIMYDLNTAQMAKFYKDLCVDKAGWNLELIDSYVKNLRPIATSYRRRAKSSLGLVGRVEPASSWSGSQLSFPTARSHDEIMYICQFKYGSSQQDDCLQQEPNKLKHSVIGKNFITEMSQIIQFSYQKNYMPIRYELYCKDKD